MGLRLRRCVVAVCRRRCGNSGSGGGKRQRRRRRRPRVCAGLFVAAWRCVFVPVCRYTGVPLCRRNTQFPACFLSVGLDVCLFRGVSCRLCVCVCLPLCASLSRCVSLPFRPVAASLAGPIACPHRCVPVCLVARRLSVVSCRVAGLFVFRFGLVLRLCLPSCSVAGPRATLSVVVPFPIRVVFLATDTPVVFACACACPRGIVRVPMFACMCGNVIFGASVWGVVVGGVACLSWVALC